MDEPRTESAAGSIVPAAGRRGALRSLAGFGAAVLALLELRQGTEATRKGKCKQHTAHKRRAEAEK